MRDSKSTRATGEWRRDEPEDPRWRDPAVDSVDLPETVGRYRITRMLGAGGFGTVYLAYDSELERSVAIKVPRPERTSGAFDVDEYLKEARIVAKLDHSAIVPVYDVGHTGDGLCYIVSKWIDGSNLSALLQRMRPAFLQTANQNSQAFFDRFDTWILEFCQRRARATRPARFGQCIGTTRWGCPP